MEANKKYSVCKISVSATSAAGEPIYDQTKEFATARELLRNLNRLLNQENTWFYGRGSDILLNGEKIAHTSDYEMIVCADGRAAQTPTISGLKMAYNERQK